MTNTFSATEVWSRANEVAVQVIGLTHYRITFEGDEEEWEAHLSAPGLDFTLPLDEDIYPLGEWEICAAILVAQLEGGVLL